MHFIRKYFINSLFFTFPIYVFLFPLLIPNSYLESYFFLSGLALRSLGFILIIWGIDSKLKNFTDGGIKGLFINWWKGENVVLKPRGLKDSITMGEGRLKVSRNFENSSIDEKVDFLLEYVEGLDDKIWDLRKQSRSEINSLRREIKEIREDLHKRIDETLEDVKLGFIGNVEKEFAGALAIITGIFCSSFSASLAQIFTVF